MKIKPSKKPGKVVMEAASKDADMLARASESSSSFRLSRLLVPVDFSKCSLKALKYAVAFAKHFNASISLIHVVAVNYGGEFGAVDMVAIEKEMADSASKQLKKLLESEVPKNLRADATVRIGQPAYTITESARDRNTDLIIIATHGYRGIKHFLLGSTAENVVRLAPCPVLTVREHEHEFVA